MLLYPDTIPPVIPHPELSNLVEVLENFPQLPMLHVSGEQLDEAACDGLSTRFPTIECLKIHDSGLGVATLKRLVMARKENPKLFPLQELSIFRLSGERAFKANDKKWFKSQLERFFIYRILSV